MAFLHIIKQSPFAGQALSSCLRLAKRDSGILLIEDGVYASQYPHPQQHAMHLALARLSVYALEPDRQARGLSEARLTQGITLVDYAGFVGLTVEYDRVMAW